MFVGCVVDCVVDGGGYFYDVDFIDVFGVGWVEYWVGVFDLVGFYLWCVGVGGDVVVGEVVVDYVFVVRV